MKRKSIIFTSFFALMLVFAGCAMLNKVNQELLSLKRLQFKLDNISNYTLAGINISKIKSASDLSLTDGLKLANAFRTNKFPADFTLNIAVKNPNDGTSGGRSTIATLTRLDWQLYIDDVPTINGVVNDEIQIPGNGQSVNLPLTLSLDLYKFFKDKGYESMLNLALAMGGLNGSASRVKLDCQPTVSTPFGSIVYPNRITIVDKEFTN
jgi:hypothetical protein